MALAAARYLNSDGDVRMGAVRDSVLIDAGPSGPRGFVPTPEAWASLAAADGPGTRLADARLLHPVEPLAIRLTLAGQF